MDSENTAGNRTFVVTDDEQHSAAIIILSNNEEAGPIIHTGVDPSLRAVVSEDTVEEEGQIVHRTAPFKSETYPYLWRGVYPLIE